LTGLAKEADLTLADVSRLIGRIRGLQGAHFFSSITMRSVSPFSQKLWTEAAADVRPDVRNVDESYKVRSDMRFAIFKAFKDAGIVIPFPQRDLHIQSDGTPVSGCVAKGQDAAASDGAS
jgi:small-conductance mechanosensitive channel